MVEEVFVDYQMENFHQNQGTAHNSSMNEQSSPLSSTVTRTLFIRNLNRSSFFDDIFASLSAFGSIADLDTRHLLSEGFVVVTYHDIRDSQSAFRQVAYFLPSVCPHLCQANLNIGVHYFVNISSESVHNDGILLIESFGVHPNDLKTLCSHFGELRRILSVDGSTVLVEYYDTRSAQRAHFSLNGEMFSGSKLFVSFLNGNTSWEVAGFGNSSFQTNSATIASILPMCLPFNLPSPFASPKATPPSSPNSSPLSSYHTSPRKETKPRTNQNSTIFSSPPSSFSALASHSHSKASLFSIDNDEETLRMFHESAVRQLSQVQIVQEQEQQQLEQEQHQQQDYVWQTSTIYPNANTLHANHNSHNSVGNSNNSYNIHHQTATHLQTSSFKKMEEVASQSYLQTNPSITTVTTTTTTTATTTISTPSTRTTSPPPQSQHQQHHQHSGEGAHRFQIELDSISKGIDKRTTLMIRNIPNKYTQDMILEFLDVELKGTYDFIYLPIDFKNKCNVGYAFINFINPLTIVTFTKYAHGKKWTRFNSEKICQLSYARIQGKDNLIRHFQNSTIMSEDKTYQPKVFHSSGPLVGQEMKFPDPFASVLEKKV